MRLTDIMDRDEVITLSSDDESDFINQKNLYGSFKIKPASKNSSGVPKQWLRKSKSNSLKKNISSIFQNKYKSKNNKTSGFYEKKCKEASKISPEIVDLVDCLEKSDEDSPIQLQATSNGSSEDLQNHSKINVIYIDGVPNENDSYKKTAKFNSTEKESRDFSSNITNEENATSFIVNNTLKPGETSNELLEEFQSKISDDKLNEGFNPNLKVFTEFVEFCGSLEEIPSDRTKLTKKLMKHYGEADCNYIKSHQFRSLIEKCKDKVNKNNLYLIAKEITDEMRYRKKNKINLNKSDLAEEKCHQIVEDYKVIQKGDKQLNKKYKFIKRIIKELDKLGNTIRNLEEQEVDLSDEENSSYVKLQRYRERFCQIYTKLCKYTKDIPDAGRIYSRKICFTESKYPAINKCIENWLNKTKRFPDFSDIMKLLESQSASLGLSSNRESIRTIAVEIFQEVGTMLQRRRIYDLWDSFSDFLDNNEDPACSNPALDQILKINFETRIKKEQAILQHYVELQEKEKVEPEEVSDEDGNKSPEESGNEDEKEIEEIENSINKKLDNAFKGTGKDGNTFGNNGWIGNENNSGNEKEPHQPMDVESDFSMKVKESKNNYKNCKSLKWRSENNCEKENKVGETESENNIIKKNKLDPEEIHEQKELKMKEQNVRNNLDVGFLAREDDNFSASTEIPSELKMKTVSCDLYPKKRVLNIENEHCTPKKKKLANNFQSEKNVFKVFKKNFQVEDEKENPVEKTNSTFDVRCCQIFTDNVFEDWNEKNKDWEKRKVFRDLTNVNKLMTLTCSKRKKSGLFLPRIFHPSFRRFERNSWKKLSKVRVMLVGSKTQKCALNQEEKSQKTLNSDSGGDSDKNKKIESTERGGNDKGSHSFSGHGNGREEDNNEDENKKKGKTSDELIESQHEEEEEDDEESEIEKEDSKKDRKIIERKFSNKKTETPPNTNLDDKAFLEIKKNVGKITDEVNELQSQIAPSPNSTSDLCLESKLEKHPEQVQSALDPFEQNQKINLIPEEEKLQFGREIDDFKEKEDKDEEKQNSKMPSRDSKSEALKEDKDEEQNLKVEDNCNTKDNEDAMKVEEQTVQKTKKDSQSCKLTESKQKHEDVQAKTLPVNQELMTIKDEIKITPKKMKNCKRFRENFSTRAADEGGDKNKEIISTIKNENIKRETKNRDSSENKPATSWKPKQFELFGQKLRKRNSTLTSDEERVKRFLLHSPSSISITPPRKLSFSRPPSQAVLQALATLRNLKGISTTIVRGKPKSEDDVVVIGGSYRKHTSQNSNLAKCRKQDIPVISSVQSMDNITPKIVTVQGNVSGFENSWPEGSNSRAPGYDSSSIRISNVWGNLPNNFMQSVQNIESAAPGCSSQQSKPDSNNTAKKKSTKKTVEYVVLD